MPQILMPSQQRSAWSDLANALQVGASIYNIKTNMDELEMKRKAAEAQAPLQQELLKGKIALTGAQAQKAGKEAEFYDRLAMQKIKLTDADISKMEAQAEHLKNANPMQYQMLMEKINLAKELKQGSIEEQLLEQKRKKAEVREISARANKLNQEAELMFRRMEAGLDTQEDQAKLKKLLGEAGYNEAQTKKVLEEIKFIGKGKPISPEEKAQIEANIDLKKAAAAAARARAGQIKMDAKIPEENKQTIREYVKKNADLTVIRNSMKNTLSQLRRQDLSDDQKVVMGEGMLKLLNSEVGRDAVGAEEAARLGSFLKFKMFNWKEPGSFVGRDLDKFIDQVSLKVDSMGQTIKQNENIMEKLRGGEKLSTDISPQYKKDVTPKQQAKPKTFDFNKKNWQKIIK